MTTSNAANSDGQRPEVEVAILARRAELGKGKTRLAATLGVHETLAAYRHLIAVCATVVRASGLPATVFFDPLPGDSAVWLPEYFRHAIQATSPDLGTRLSAAASEALARAAGVLLIGTDCPYLTPELLTAAAEALRSHDAVLGPSSDGGYYLLGIKQIHRDLFTTITWSTDRVAAQTRDVLAKAGCTVRELPTLDDIDTEADWDVYRSTIEIHKA